MRFSTREPSMPLHFQKELLDSVFGREIVLHIGMATFILASFINFMVTQDRGFLAFPVFLFVDFVYRLYILAKRIKMVDGYEFRNSSHSARAACGAATGGAVVQVLTVRVVPVLIEGISGDFA